MKENARPIEVEVLPPASSVTSLERDERMMRFIANLMDTAFVIPGTKIRFGLDPIIGFLPGIGDASDALISALMLSRAARHGVPKVVLARMALNVIINAIGGALPLVGDAFSVWFKSNVMNYELLRKHATARHAATSQDWLFVIGLIAFVVLIIGLAAAAVIFLVTKVAALAR